MNLIKIDHKSQYITFRLANNLIGVSILAIREIVPKFKITEVQKSPEFVLGLMNLRGQILTVFDVGVLLGFEKRHIHSDSHVIIFKHKEVGFIVDQIGDVVGANEKNIESIPANIEPEIQKYMESIVNLSGEILMVMNAKKVLATTQAQDEDTKDFI